MSTPEYLEWANQPTPENMGRVVDALDPLLNSEIQRYTGPKPLLKTKARELTIGAIKKYDPASGAKLQSWVVTQLQPLSRYGQRLRPVHASEAVIRQAAELNRLRRELSDELGRDPDDDELADKSGISTRKILRIRRSTPAVVAESAFESQDEDDVARLPAMTTPNRMGSAEEIVFTSLAPRDQAIFRFKTGRGGTELSNEEIARRLGVSAPYVSQRSKYIADQINNLYMRKMI